MAARVISWFLRLLLAAVFGSAGVVKVWNFSEWRWATPDFLNDILNYQLVPWYFAMAMAAYLPWLEIVAALALLTRRWRRGALLWVVAMLLVFLGALGSAWYRGVDVSCGCFGHEIEKAAWWIPLGRDVILLALALTVPLLDRDGPTNPTNPNKSEEDGTTNRTDFTKAGEHHPPHS